MTVQVLATHNLEQLSRERLLGFSKDEIRAIGDFFAKQKRDPTIAEVEMIAQAWSEHTRHKTLRGGFEVRTGFGKNKNYKNLLEETVFAATQKLRKPWVLSAFEDNAGVVAFDKNWAIAIKVETHNHPSALMPYGGASTGLGGVIRDVLGTGLGASPLAGIDVFCVSPNEPKVLDGLAAGVRDYGNRMGIPTVAGAICYDDAYAGLPLVFCGCVGILPRSKVKKRGPHPGDFLYVIGGKTGRDGIHGATFSSQALTENLTSSVVQIGNPILEKKVWDFLLQANRRDLYNSITDLGAGGIACALWEMAAEGKAGPLGVRARLDNVPLKQAGMEGWEILVSESQERMMISVPRAKQLILGNLLRQFELDFSRLGNFVLGGEVQITFKGESLVDVPIRFLKEVPKKRFDLQVESCKFRAFPFPVIPAKAGIQAWTPAFAGVTKRKGIPGIYQFGLRLLASPNIASKEKIIRQYDHEVGARTVIKPLVGHRGHAPADAVVLRPVAESYRGIALGLGFAGKEGSDPAESAWNAFDEALRNVVAVGGKLEHMSVLDNYCAGSTADTKVLRELVLVSEALRDASLAFGVPFISGKDSLNNTAINGKNIPTVILVTALGVLKDIRTCVTPVLKTKGNLLYLVSFSTPKSIFKISEFLNKQLAVSCHDISDGGLFVTLSEMVLDSSFGAEISLSTLENLFAPQKSSFVLEVPLKHKARFEKLLGIPRPLSLRAKQSNLIKDSLIHHMFLGKVTARRKFEVKLRNKLVATWSSDELAKAFRGL